MRSNQKVGKYGYVLEAKPMMYDPDNDAMVPAKGDRRPKKITDLSVLKMGSNATIEMTSKKRKEEYMKEDVFLNAEEDRLPPVLAQIEDGEFDGDYHQADERPGPDRAAHRGGCLAREALRDRLSIAKGGHLLEPLPEAPAVRLELDRVVVHGQGIRILALFPQDDTLLFLPLAPYAKYQN